MHVPASAPVAVNQEERGGKKKSNGGYPGHGSNLLNVCSTRPWQNNKQTSIYVPATAA